MTALTEAEKQVLIVTAFLSGRRIPRSPAVVSDWGLRYFGMFKADWTGCFDDLLARGELALQNGELDLTELSRATAGSLLAEHPKYRYFYNEFFERAAASQAHARFCERVYGKNLAQHGLASMAQVDWMIQALSLGPANRILELGCGNGGLGEYISDQSGAQLTGIDGSEVGIRQAQERTRGKKDRLSFEVADMARYTCPAGAFDSVLAIDAVYFTSDQAGLLDRMRAITGPGGRMGVFYSTWQQEEGQRDSLKPEATPFYRAAAGLGHACQTWDFTRQEIEHWACKYETALAMEAEFAAEGQQWLHARRLEEAAAHMEHVQAGLVARYFYLVNFS